MEELTQQQVKSNCDQVVPSSYIYNIRFKVITLANERTVRGDVPANQETVLLAVAG